jgi:hypothetical protein
MKAIKKGSTVLYKVLGQKEVKGTVLDVTPAKDIPGMEYFIKWNDGCYSTELLGSIELVKE